MLDLAYPERYVPEIREPESDCNPAVRWHPGRLWSLWDMLTVFARPFVLLGEHIHEMRAMSIFGGGKPLSVEDLQELQAHLTAVLDDCRHWDLCGANE